jgi:allantoin racemase
LWINPVGTEAFDADTRRILDLARRADTQLDVVSLPAGRPQHLEYHAYEGLVVADIVDLTYHASKTHDAVVIGCFYDVGLREAREVSGRAIVTAPCQSATAIASNLGNRFSVLVGRRKWIPKMRENVHLYGHGPRLASMRPLDLGVHDFQADHQATCDRMMAEGRKAVQEDGAEVLILAEGHCRIRLPRAHAGQPGRAGDRRRAGALQIRRDAGRNGRALRLVSQPGLGQRGAAAARARRLGVVPVRTSP